MISWILNLLRGNDSTQDWPEARRQPLTLDLSNQSLNGIRIGEPVNRLSLLGRPKRGRDEAFRCYDFPTLGIRTFGDKTKGIQDFGIALDVMQNDPEMQPAESVTVQLQGRAVTLRPGSNLSDLIDPLKIELKEDRDEEELIATATVGEFDCEFECALDGRLRYINLFKR